ncbi:hypothetical protein RIF29_22181 [Crotalaria pallida]|uniref:WAT1-related protein n=1 Tax=Crotalaria pallida TaxID=3830 RepID=A0AAN9IA58_CROPI
MASNGVIPFLAMVLVQLGYAGMNITSKLAMQSGMNPLILVAYRQMFGTLSLAPFAYWLERNTAPRMTIRTGFMIFLSSLTGVSGNQVLYFMGLKYSTPTIACALTNLLPAFTFILAVLFRQEYLRIKTTAGIAKVLGTGLSVGGALLLSFYHGHLIGIKESSIHWRYADKMESSSPSPTGISLFLGPLALIGSALVWSVWFIIQADISKSYPAPYTSSLYMCFMASIQCVVIALCDEHKLSAWSLHNHMRLVSSLYAGIVCSGLAYGLLSWTIARKGPLYASVFTPMLLIITAVVSWALLEEKLYVGTALGSLVIVIGLYSVLWGKSQEMNENGAIQGTDKEVINHKVKDEMKDLELQLYNPSNGNNHHAATT